MSFSAFVSALVLQAFIPNLSFELIYIKQIVSGGDKGITGRVKTPPRARCPIEVCYGINSIISTLVAVLWPIGIGIYNKSS